MIEARNKRSAVSLRRTGAAMLLGLLAVIAGALAPTPANAQFVCDSTTPGGADGATATGAGSFACGTNATANGIQSIALGTSAFATANQTLAVGYNSLASAIGAAAVGQNASANGVNATAIGNSTEANGDLSTAIGDSSLAHGQWSTAVGTSAHATATSSTAIGENAEATFANSTAIGAGAQTTAANQVAIGTASNTYKLAGLTSAASSAAQTGPVSVVTTDANGNLAAVDLASLGLGGGADLSEVNARLDEHDKKISKNTEGVAIALAMAGVPTLTATEKFAMSANWGTFEGENGFAGGAAIRLDSNVQINGGIGFGGDTVGGRAGVRVGW